MKMTKSMESLDSAKMTKLANQVHGGEEVNEVNMREWFYCDSCELRLEMLSSVRKFSVGAARGVGQK
jgi:predicted Zn-dependent protease